MTSEQTFEVLMCEHPHEGLLSHVHIYDSGEDGNCQIATLESDALLSRSPQEYSRTGVLYCTRFEMHPEDVGNVGRSVKAFIHKV